MSLILTFANEKHVFDVINQESFDEILKNFNELYVDLSDLLIGSGDPETFKDPLVKKFIRELNEIKARNELIPLLGLDPNAKDFDLWKDTITHYYKNFSIHGFFGVHTLEFPFNNSDANLKLTELVNATGVSGLKTLLEVIINVTQGSKKDIFCKKLTLNFDLDPVTVLEIIENICKEKKAIFPFEQLIINKSVIPFKEFTSKLLSFLKSNPHIDFFQASQDVIINPILKIHEANQTINKAKKFKDYKNLSKEAIFLVKNTFDLDQTKLKMTDKRPERFEENTLYYYLNNSTDWECAFLVNGRVITKAIGNNNILVNMKKFHACVQLPAEIIFGTLSDKKMLFILPKLRMMLTLNLSGNCITVILKVRFIHLKFSNVLLFGWHCKILIPQIALR